MSDLENAIQLIRQGRRAEAQSVLQSLIKSDPRNIPAWFWYVESCTTTERRIQTLEMCLKMNPGNVQVEQALQKFRNHSPAIPAQPEPPRPVSPSPSTISYREEKPTPVRTDRYEDHSYRSSFEPEPASLDYSDAGSSSTLYQNDYGYEPYQYEVEVEPEKPKSAPKEQWELEYESFTNKSKSPKNSKISKSSEKIRSYNFFEVWSTALTVQDYADYADLLDDPKATLGRAFTWIALAGLVNAAVLPVFMLLNPSLGDFSEMGIFMFGMLIAVPIMGIIGFAIWAGIQNIFAVLLGGTGYYTRTAYALAAFTAPMTILTSLFLIVPIVGQCLAIPLSFYTLVLNVRALRASHSLSILAALGVVFGPSIFLMIFVCLAMVMGMFSLPAS